MYAYYVPAGSGISALLPATGVILIGHVCHMQLYQQVLNLWLGKKFGSFL